MASIPAISPTGSGPEPPLQVPIEDPIHRRSTMGINILVTCREVEEEEDEAGLRFKTPL
jgi:hypothetical protein